MCQAGHLVEAPSCVKLGLVADAVRILRRLIPPVPNMEDRYPSGSGYGSHLVEAPSCVKLGHPYLTPFFIRPGSPARH